MPELTHPWWLLGLLAIPLIRWLHRLDPPATPLRVAALFVWPQAQDAASAQPGRRPPDPAWRRRALIAALILLGLAEPFAPRSSTPLILWLDTSFSNFAVDESGRRIDRMLDLALAESRDRGAVELRLLATPQRRLALAQDLPRANLLDWIGDPVEVATLPPTTAFDPTTEHWLISDGADPRLPAWLALQPISRVLQSGAATENVGIERMALRRSLRRDAGPELLLVVRNGGLRPARRDLRLLDDADRELRAATLDLPAGESRALRFQLDSAERRGLTALLTGTDALALDDRMQLDASGLAPLTVSLQGRCGAALHAAIGADPGVRLVEAGARVAIGCGQLPAGNAGLYLARATGSTESTEPPVWIVDRYARAGPHLAAAWIGPIDGLAEPRDGDRVLLRAGDTALVVRRRDIAAPLEVRFDLAAPALVAQPIYPALVGSLIDLAAGRAEPDWIATWRAASASHIRPARLAPGGDARPLAQAISIPLSGWPALAAALLLAYDLLLRRRRRRVDAHLNVDPA